MEHWLRLETLMNVLINCSSLPEHGWRSMDLKKKMPFLSFKVYIFVSFSYLITLSMNSSIKLNRSRDSSHHHLIFDLKRKVLNIFTIKNIICCRYFAVTFAILMEFHPIPTLPRVFIINCTKVHQICFCIYWKYYIRSFILFC